MRLEVVMDEKSREIKADLKEAAGLAALSDMMIVGMDGNGSVGVSCQHLGCSA